MRLILFLIPVLAFAQLDDNTITVSASRPTAVQPDQAVIGITVDTGTDVTLDDVLGTLKDVGVTAANLTYVDQLQGVLSPVGNNPLEWQFTLPTPLANLNGTLATLLKIQQNTASGRAPSPVSYSVQGTQVSPAAQAANSCPYPALLSDAQKQAQALAQVAGGTLGAIVAISDQPLGGDTIPAERVGDFAVLSFSTLAFVAPASPSPSPTCSLTVQFKLVH